MGYSSNLHDPREYLSLARSEISAAVVAGLYTAGFGIAAYGGFRSNQPAGASLAMVCALPFAAISLSALGEACCHVGSFVRAYRSRGV
ncbi:MAG: hypothetical protein HYW25_04530 [Candidatus Aenigmarchaeota archaeon]|nr:hypothetical protein [Candidatus Aenigmarchaeota archaeon]